MPRVELATKAVTDAAILAAKARSNHTGEQAISTVTGLQPALNGLSRVEVGGAYVTTFLVDLTAPDAADVGALDLAVAPGLRTGKGLSFAPVMSTASQDARGNGTAYATPLHLSRPMTLSVLGCHVLAAGSAGALVHLWLFADDGSGGFPGVQLVDGGTVDATTTGEKRATISYVAPAGTYWVVAAPQGAPATNPQLRTISSGFPNVGVSVGGDGTAFGYVANCYTAPATTTLPVSWPAVANVDILPPRVFVA